MRTKDNILKDADNVDDRSVQLVEVLVDIRDLLAKFAKGEEVLHVEIGEPNINIKK